MKTKQTDKDTRKKSMSEALLNSFGGYPIGYGLGIVILPLSVGWIQEDPFTVNLFITLIYAAVSFVRTYFLRRLFDKFGYDDNFIRLGYKGFNIIFNHMQESVIIYQIFRKFKDRVSSNCQVDWQDRLFINEVIK